MNLFLDIIGFIYGFLILWTIFTAKLALLPAALFPPFGKILAQGAEDAPIRSVFLLRRSGDIVDVCEAAFRVFLLDNPERLEIPEGDVCTFTRSDGDGRTLYAAADGIAEITALSGFEIKAYRAP